LPWRANTDPYRVLVSELMLQQTQVKTVIPYYHRFLKLFPTAQALAKAPETAVLKAWEGLGYYRRARFLHAAAKAVVAQGSFPSTFEGLRDLPGVGDYTAAAVGSIGFGLPLPVLDGNVARVISRVLALKTDALSKAGKAAILDYLKSEIDRTHPGDFNQALMELGALVCSPRQPDCPCCPLSEICIARKLGKAEDFPVLGAKPKIEKIYKVALLAKAGASLLMSLRSGSGRSGDQGRMLGYWQFPEWEASGAKGQAAALDSLLKSLGLRGKAQKLGRFRHNVTRYDIHVEVYLLEVNKKKLKDWNWISVDAVKNLPLAKAEKNILDYL
jgi:A/G-specific adenine glycosylase